MTSSSVSDPTQLHAQAATIVDLVRQRDSLLREVEEERARWQVERDGFQRMAEALIMRRSRGAELSYREEASTVDYRITECLYPDAQELERQVASLDADNRALRHKVSSPLEIYVLIQITDDSSRWPILIPACSVSSQSSLSYVRYYSCSPLR